MREFGSWYYDLARRSDGSFVHLGPPEVKRDVYANWDCSGAYLLAYSLPLKKLILTGRKPAMIPQLNASSAEQLIRDGRGWSNKDRDSAYKQLSEKELLERLSSWSPIVRGRAAEQLATRKNPPLTAIVKMLGSANVDQRVGACLALESLKSASAVAIPELTKSLGDPDLWVRVKAADALASMGPAAMPVLPKLLERIAVGPTKEDPRAMEQRFLCFAVFGKMLKKSVEGVDKELLRKAVVLGLQNQDGRARGEIGGIYQRLTADEIKPLLPAIREAIVKPSPSGEMFADGVRLNGCELFAKHQIPEGMQLCFNLLELDRWGKANRVKRCFAILAMYGSAAKPLLPELRKLESQLKDQPLQQLNQLIKTIETAQ